jgi:hypothetical protein
MRVQRRTLALVGRAIEQRRDRFPVGALLASFVGTPENGTLSVDLYPVQAKGEVPPGSC